MSFVPYVLDILSLLSTKTTSRPYITRSDRELIRSCLTSLVEKVISQAQSKRNTEVAQTILNIEESAAEKVVSELLA